MPFEQVPSGFMVEQGLEEVFFTNKDKDKGPWGRIKSRQKSENKHDVRCSQYDRSHFKYHHEDVILS